MKWLLRLYPRAWRQRYGAEFLALLAAAPRTRWIVVNVVAGALDARQREGALPIRRLMPWMLLIVVNLGVGWLNYRATDDVQPVAAALLVAGFAFTYWRPRSSWLFVLLLWIAVPISGAVADAANFHPGMLKPHPLYETLVAVVPTALGAMAGAAARWLLRISLVRA